MDTIVLQIKIPAADANAIADRARAMRPRVSRNDYILEALRRLAEGEITLPPRAEDSDDSDETLDA